MYRTLIFLGAGRPTGIGTTFGYILPCPRCDTGLGTKTGDGLLCGLAGLFCGFLFFGDSSILIEANFLTWNFKLLNYKISKSWFAASFLYLMKLMSIDISLRLNNYFKSGWVKKLEYIFTHITPWFPLPVPMGVQRLLFYKKLQVTWIVGGILFITLAMGIGVFLISFSLSFSFSGSFLTSKEDKELSFLSLRLFLFLQHSVWSVEISLWYSSLSSGSLVR